MNDAQTILFDAVKNEPKIRYVDDWALRLGWKREYVLLVARDLHDEGLVDILSAPKGQLLALTMRGYG